jgi:YesN/AraC family two-component response regulator
MITILFVDDEPNILKGLQRMLHPMRREWDLCFANGGAEALAILAEKKVDVIVSDMKMPGMDGAQLLEEVSRKYPHIMRIILSGYSEKELTVRSSGAVHEYLTKPCDADILKAAVNTVAAVGIVGQNPTP